MKEQTAMWSQDLPDVDQRSDSTDIAEDEGSHVEVNVALTVAHLCQCVRDRDGVGDVYLADESEARGPIRALDQELPISENDPSAHPRIHRVCHLPETRPDPRPQPFAPGLMSRVEHRRDACQVM